MTQPSKLLRNLASTCAQEKYMNLSQKKKQEESLNLHKIEKVVRARMPRKMTEEEIYRLTQTFYQNRGVFERLSR